MEATEGMQGLNLNGAWRSTIERASWDENRKECFVNLSKETANMKSGCKKGCSEERWAKIAVAMETRFPESRFSAEQLKQLERDLKKSYKYLKGILKQPGFTWDHERSTLKASDNDWRNLFQRDPKAKKWHRRILPYFAVLDALYGGHCVQLTQAGSDNHCVQVPQAVSYNSGSALFQHNMVDSYSAPTGPNEETNPRRILPEDDPSLNINFEDSEGWLNSLNLPPRQNQNLRTDSQNQPDWHVEQFGIVGQNGAAPNSDYSIHRCVNEYELLGSNDADLSLVGEIFKDEQNRLTFLTVRCKKEWLRDCIAERKKKAYGK